MTEIPTQHGLPRVRIDTPEGWSDVPLGGPGLSIAEDTDNGLGFRTNFVVQEGPWKASLPALAMQAWAQARSFLPDYHVISVERTSVHGVPARLIRASFEAEDLRLVSERLLAVKNGRALDVNLTEHAVLSHSLDGWVAEFVNESVTWDTVPTDDDAPAPEVEEPQRDFVASVALGEDLEDLDIIQEHQPTSHPNVRISAEALEAFDSAVDGTPVPERFREKLHGFGLVDEAGHLTEDARRVAVRPGNPSIVVEVNTASRASTLTVTILEDFARIVAGPSVRAINAGVDPRDVSLEIAGHLDVAPLVSAWLGLGPVWPLETNLHQLGTDALMARLDGGPGVPAPEFLTTAGRQAWSEPWTWWSLHVDAAPDWDLDVLTMGDVAMHIIRATDAGTIAIDEEPLRPERVWECLINGIGESRVAFHTRSADA